MPDVDTRAGTVHYEETGEGPVVVLLHATLHDHHDFDPIVPALAERRRVVALDWPGHGSSADAAQPVTGSLLADVLEDVVAGLDLPPATFVGSSVGGFAAARLAITQPDRVAGLVLVNGSGFQPQNALTRAFCRVLGVPAIARRVLPRMVPRYMRSRTDSDRAISQAAVARARSAAGAQVGASMWRSFADPAYDLRDRATEVACPVLLLWGDRDPIVPLRAGRATQARLPQSRLERFATGHVVFSSDPDGFLAQLVPFLDGVAAVADREGERGG